MDSEVQLPEAERMKFFTDAVVAIAMTLLILPLLESVADAATHHLTTKQFMHEHGGQLFSFALSFAIIAGFWVSHERLYSNVDHWTGRLMVLNIAWMFAIVWLPVATAMVGSMETDRLQLTLYIGTMLVASLLMLVMNLEIRAHPDVRAGKEVRVGSLAAQLALVTLYAVALAVALVVPGAGYLSLFLLFGSGPLQALYARLLGSRA